MSSTLTGSITNIIRETISPGIEESLPEIDKTFNAIKASSFGVTREGIGRDWKVKHTFCGSIAGSHQWRAAAGGTINFDGSSGATGFTAFTTSTPQSFPALNEMTSPGYIQQTITLVEGFGNFPVPLHLLRADRLDASVGSAVAEIVKGAAMRQSLSQAHALFKYSTTSGKIGTYTSSNAGGGAEDIFAATSNAVGTTTIPVTLTAGRIRAFYPGMVVDVFESTSKINNVPVYVSEVDYLQNQVKLVSSSGTINMTANTVTDIVPYGLYDGTTLTSPSGFEDWLKAGAAASARTVAANTVFGIQIAGTGGQVYPQFRSLVGTETGALSSTILNKYVGGFLQGYGSTVDTLLMTDGTMLGLIENIEDAGQLVRFPVQGESIDVQLGFEPVGYRYGGKTLRIMTSTLMPIGTLYGVKLGQNNIKRYVPPRLNGAGSQAKFDGEVEFVGPVLGLNGIFVPSRKSTGAVTDFLEAPYLNWMEFCPSTIPGIKISGLSESIKTG